MNKAERIRVLKKDSSGILLPFNTKNGKYNIIRPGDPLGIQRWTEREKLSIVLGTGKSFSILLDTLKNVELLLGSDKSFAEIRTEAILAVNGLRRGIVELSKDRYHAAFYLASIFIWKEGTDPLKWSMEQATEWIEDWQEEGLSESDFFSFSIATVVGFKEQFEKLKAEISREEAVLSDITTLTNRAKESL